MFETVREDLRRWDEGEGAFKVAIRAPGAWAVMVYRLRHWIHSAPMPAPLRAPLKVVSNIVQAGVVIATNIQLPETATIGPGLFIAHTGYIVVANHTVLGKHCTLTQGVTIGHAGGTGGSLTAVPVIGDRVYIGPGAAVIGDISVGDDAMIGVSAVVTKSLPPRAVAVGNPARVVSQQGSFAINHYPGMDTDEARAEALAQADPPARPKKK